MTSALTVIALAFFLSASSLLVVLYRVSPLTAPEFALPFFFISIFICLSASVAFVLSVTKTLLTHQPFLSGTYVSSSLRQGVFVALATCIVIFLGLLQIVNWWIALLVYAVFALIEMAVGR